MKSHKVELGRVKYTHALPLPFRGSEAYSKRPSTQMKKLK